MRCRARAARPRRLLLQLALALAGGCGSEAESPLDAARKQLEEGQVDAALETLRAQLDATPADPALNLLYGRALLQAGQPSLAVWSLARAAADPELGLEAGLTLARAQIDSGSFDEAIATVDRQLEREPRSARARLLRIEANMLARREQDALADIELALEAAPDHLGLEMTRFQALLALERADEAREALTRIRSRIDELEMLEPVQRDQLAGRYCAAEASFLHESGDAAAAQRELAVCLERFPGHPGVIAAAVRFYDETGAPERASEVLREAVEADPSKLALRVDLANRYRAAGDPAASERLLRAAAESHPEIWAALADHHLSLDQKQPALEALESALATAGPNVSPDWILTRADLLIQLGRFDEAEKASQAIEQPVYRHAALGRLALARGEPRRALEELDASIRLWPDGAMARYLAAQAAEQLGDFDRAESDYREAFRAGKDYTDAGLKLAELAGSRGRHQEAINILLAYIRAKPGDPRGFERAVEYAFAAKQPELAGSLLKGYRERPEFAARSSAFAIRSALERQGAGVAARGIEASRLDLGDPQHASLLEAASEVFAALGNPAKALERIDAALRAHPEASELHRIRGSALAAQSAGEAAGKSFERALELDAANARALLGLALLAEGRGDLDAAVALYDRAAAAEPDASEARTAAARIQLARGAAADAEQRFEAALRANPRDALAARELASILLSRKRGAEARALDLSLRAVRFGQRAGDFAVHSQVLLAQGSPEKALAAAERAHELEPDSPSIRFHLARALIAVGRAGDARAELERALAGGAFPEEAEARQALASLPPDPAGEPGSS